MELAYWIHAFRQHPDTLRRHFLPISTFLRPHANHVQDQNQRWEHARMILCLTVLTTIGCQTVGDMVGS